MSVRNAGAPSRSRARSTDPSMQDERVIGLTKRIWAGFFVLVLVALGTSIALFMAWGERASLRASLEVAESKLKEASIALNHAREAEKQALADKDLLVRELSKQGIVMAEITRDEEQAKNRLQQFASGRKSVEKKNQELRDQLKKAEQDVIALNAQLEIAQSELDQAKAEIDRLRREAEPYSSGPARPREGRY